MKLLLLPLLMVLLLSGTCRKTAGSRNCFRARLAIKGICMNYVIQVLDKNTGALPVEKSWTDESDGRVYQNVFALGSVCSFPDLKEGDEFYFTLATAGTDLCAVCKAYRPVPAVRNAIVVQPTPCP